MDKHKPKNRTEAIIPEETKHLNKGEKQVLDMLAEVEHLDGQAREDLIAESNLQRHPEPRADKRSE